MAYVDEIGFPPSASNSSLGGSDYIEIESRIWQSESNFNMADEKIVVFNIGGVVFETLESSLENPKQPIEKLKDKAFLQRHWDDDKEQFFFDRDPETFQSVLNYMRTGTLHLPKHMCSPQIVTELIYWGLPRIDIEPCCWKGYSTGITALENLRKLEYERMPAYVNGRMMLARRMNRGSRLQNLKLRLWYIVSDPSWSRVSQIYNSFSIIFVWVSIISFALVSIPSISEKSDRMSILGTMLNDVRNGRIQETVTVLYFVDFICFIFFAFEMLLVVWTHPDIHSFFRSSTAVIELTALAPDAFNILLVLLCLREDPSRVVEDVQVGRTFLVFRTLRLFRLFRLVRRVPALMIIVYSFYASCKDLFSVLLVVIISSIFFAGCMHYADDRKVFSSIPEGVWWAIVTMTTCGYGDMIPTNTLGKLIGAVCALSGVLLLGIMAPTLVHNFITYYYLFRYMSDRESAFIKEASKRERQRGNDLFIVSR